MQRVEVAIYIACRAIQHPLGANRFIEKYHVFPLTTSGHQCVSSPLVLHYTRV